MTDGENERATTASGRSRAETTAGEPSAQSTVTAELVNVRRTPRYTRFMLVGVFACVVAAFILTYSLPQGNGYDRNSVFGYMVLVAIAVGVTLGALAALIAARIARRGSRTLPADRIEVREADAADASSAEAEPAPQREA